jgi:hypothetical protein
MAGSCNGSGGGWNSIKMALAANLGQLGRDCGGRTGSSGGAPGRMVMVGRRSIVPAAKTRASQVSDQYGSQRGG